MLRLRLDLPTGRYYAASAEDDARPEWPVHPSRVYSALVAAAYQSGEGMTPARRTALEWLEGQEQPSMHVPDSHIAIAPTVYVPPGDSVERKGKTGEEQYEHPVHRWRQARSFPSVVILGEPTVTLYWEATPSPEVFDMLDVIARGVTHVGTSHSMAIVRFDLAAHANPEPNYLPFDQGDIDLRVVRSGRLFELDEIHKRSMGIRRPVPAYEYLARYLKVGSRPQIRPSPYELLPFRAPGLVAAADSSEIVGRAIRAALMSALGEDAPPEVHGHGDGEHVGWLTLPDVGHVNARGMATGFGLALPVDIDDAQRMTIFRGLAGIRSVHSEALREFSLAALRGGDPLPKALHQDTWCRPSYEWATVTPVFLDRPPKNATPETIRAALADSLVTAGFPEPLEIEFGRYSVFNGAPNTFEFSGKIPRFHASVRFGERVAGPVFAGRKRFFGVGLFRPLGSRE